MRHCVYKLQSNTLRPPHQDRKIRKHRLSHSIDFLIKYLNVFNHAAYFISNTACLGLYGFRLIVFLCGVIFRFGLIFVFAFLIRKVNLADFRAAVCSFRAHPQFGIVGIINFTDIAEHDF